MREQRHTSGRWSEVARGAGILLVAAAGFMVLGGPRATAAPSQMNYQGQLKSSGTLFTGTASMKFAIVDGTTWLWSNDSTGSATTPPTNPVSVPVSNGLFTAMLGATPMRPLGPAVFATAAAPVLRVWVSTGGAFEQLTDQPLSSAAYALSGGADASWVVSGGNIYRLGGNVGIGTAAPDGLLSLKDGSSVLNCLANKRLANGWPPVAEDATYTIQASGPNSGALAFATGNWERMRIASNGNVGVGAGNSSATLFVAGTSEVADGSSPDTYAYASFGVTRAFENSNLSYIGLTQAGQYPWGIGVDGSHSLIIGPARVGKTITVPFFSIAANSGYVGIGTASPQVALDVAGTARVRVLEITGADVAERFPVSGGAEAGTVLAIDASEPGRLRVCDEPMSRNVAGVVSGAGALHAGVVLRGADGADEGVPVALTGRVWVKADATERPIHVGDLLVSAGRPGYAAAAKTPSKAAGRILGKAMSSLERGRGLVLVLVSLQ